MRKNPTLKGVAEGLAFSNVTLNTISSPSSADASSMVRGTAVSSLRTDPVAVSVAVIVSDVPDTARFTVNVSSGSTCQFSFVATVKVFVSPAVPMKRSAVVFAA